MVPVLMGVRGRDPLRVPRQRAAPRYTWTAFGLPGRRPEIVGAPRVGQQWQVRDSNSRSFRRRFTAAPFWPLG